MRKHAENIWERAMKSASAGTFQTKDHTRLRYLDSHAKGGPRSHKPPLMFIYGLACSEQHWKYPWSYFTHSELGFPLHRPLPHLSKQTWRGICLDIRGHGQSLKDQTPPSSLDDLVDDHSRFLKNKRIRKPVLLGQSFGGCLALEIASRAPEQYAAVVLVASPSRDPGSHLPLPQLSALLWQKAIWLREQLPLSVQLLHKLLLNPASKTILIEIVRTMGFNPSLSNTADIEEYINTVLLTDPLCFWSIAQALNSFDVANIGEKIDIPVLIIAGEHDKIVPMAETERLHQYLPTSQTYYLKHGSHCPHFDDPFKVCQRIETFLQEVTDFA